MRRANFPVLDNNCGCYFNNVFNFYQDAGFTFIQNGTFYLWEIEFEKNILINSRANFDLKAVIVIY